MATHRALHLLSHDRKYESVDECKCVSENATDGSTDPIDRNTLSDTLECGNDKCGEKFQKCPRDGRSTHDPDDKVEDCLVKELSAQFKENFIGLG